MRGLRIAVALFSCVFLSASTAFADDLVVKRAPAIDAIDESSDSLRLAAMTLEVIELSASSRSTLAATIDALTDELSDVDSLVSRRKGKRKRGVRVAKADWRREMRDVRKASRTLARAIEESGLDGADLTILDRHVTRALDGIGELSDAVKRPRGVRAGDRVSEGRKWQDQPADDVVVESEPALQSMNATRFASLLGEVESAHFSDDKLTIVRAATHGNLFLVEQVVALMAAFSFDSDRVELAVMLHPLTLDHENWFSVAGAFDFSSNAREMAERVGI